MHLCIHAKKQRYVLLRNHLFQRKYTICIPIVTVNYYSYGYGQKFKRFDDLNSIVIEIVISVHCDFLAIPCDTHSIFKYGAWLFRKYDMRGYEYLLLGELPIVTFELIYSSADRGTCSLSFGNNYPLRKFIVFLSNPFKFLKFMFRIPSIFILYNE